MFRSTDKIAATESFLASVCDKEDEALPPEIEEGNVEYKLKLVDPSPERMEHLVTQMKWRLAEGGGEALYEIGISDKGHLVGLTDCELDASMASLKEMASRLNADCNIIREHEVTDESTSAAIIRNNIKTHLNLMAAATIAKGGIAPSPAETAAAEENPLLQRHRVAEVLVRKRVEEEHFLEIRLAIMGGTDVGKSTLIGVLTHSDLDNGYGRTRSRAFNHKHEIESGRTSSISYDIIGFDSAGKLINYSSSNVQTPQQICDMSSKVVTLVDTCGHNKYLKTTISGLTAKQPDYACLIVNGIDGHVNDMAREHLGVAMVLRMPLFVCITKIDVATSEEVKSTMCALLRLLKGPGKRVVPVIIKNEDDLVATVTHFGNGSVIPIFLVSSVTGDSIPNLIRFLNLLPHPLTIRHDLNDQPLHHNNIINQSDILEFEFHIHDIYNVPDVGHIVGGSLRQGTLNMRQIRHLSQTLLLGPVGVDGQFVEVRVTSVHRFCRPVQFIRATQTATLAIEPVNHRHESTLAHISYADSNNRLLSTSTQMTAITSSAMRRKRKKSTAGSPSPPWPAHTSKSSLNALPCLDNINSDHEKSVSTKEDNDIIHTLTSTPSRSLPPIRRGMVLLSMNSITSLSANTTYTFDAMIHVLFHSTNLSATQTAVVYCGSVRQACRVIWVTCNLITPLESSNSDRDDAPATNSSSSSPPQSGSLKTGHRGRVSFEFLNEPEWIKPGMTLLVREGRVGRMKCVGTVVAVPSTCRQSTPTPSNTVI